MLKMYKNALRGKSFFKKRFLQIQFETLFLSAYKFSFYERITVPTKTRSIIVFNFGRGHTLLERQICQIKMWLPLGKLIVFLFLPTV